MYKLINKLSDLEQVNHEAARTLIEIIENASSFSKKEPQKGHNIQQFPHKRRRKKQKTRFDKDFQDLEKKTNTLSKTLSRISCRKFT